MADKFAGYQVGQVLHAVAATVQELRTKPPSPYTEDELMDHMLNAQQFGESQAEKDILREVGLGTARTRGAVIKGLLSREYMTSRKKGKNHQLNCTERGGVLLGLLPAITKSASLTARWELALKQVAEPGSKVRPEHVKQKISSVVTTLVAEGLGAAGKK